FPHGGEEFLFVIQGQVQVTIAEHSISLEAGDSVYFDSELPHSVLSLGEQQAQVLAVTCSDQGPTAGRRAVSDKQA
ncbi:MAG: cupin domain-containing protein, partial [Alcaligenes sp.]|nr:cupin domain-containing protein [Alcaligenes sp.]